MFPRTFFLTFLALLALAAPGAAGEWSLSGSAGVELRGFFAEPRWDRQLDGIQPSFHVSPEFRFRSGEGRHQISVVPFARIDGRDEDRTHVDLREGYWRYIGRDWELLAGVNRVFWGVTESRHLVNVINQVDLLEDIDEEDFLGQPMVNVAVQRSWGRLEAYVLPGFRERSFPGVEGRLRPPLPVDEGAARYESSAGDRHVDYALRYSHFLGNWDVGLSWFRGTGREPRLVPAIENGDLVPYYDIIQQVGLDLQYTGGAWLWKLEGIAREGQGRSFTAAVAGFEYTFYQVGDSAADIGFLMEYQYDGRDASAPATPSNDDVFLGGRLALNDNQDTQLLLGAVVDREAGSVLASVEAERRIGARFTIEIEGRWITGAGQDDALSPLREDSHLTVGFSYHF